MMALEREAVARGLRGYVGAGLPRNLVRTYIHSFNIYMAASAVV